MYTWASDYIRDKAFDAFLTLGSDRMMPLIVNYRQAQLGGFHGLLIEPIVHKLLTGTSVIGRMKNLDTGKSEGFRRLGPWTKHLYQNHNQSAAHVRTRLSQQSSIPEVNKSTIHGIQSNLFQSEGANFVLLI